MEKHLFTLDRAPVDQRKASNHVQFIETMTYWGTYRSIGLRQLHHQKVPAQLWQQLRTITSLESGKPSLLLLKTLAPQRTSMCMGRLQQVGSS